MSQTATKPRLSDFPRERLLGFAEEQSLHSCRLLDEDEVLGASPEVGGHHLHALVLELRALRFTLGAASAGDDRVEEVYETWAEVSLFGHRTVVGHLRETFVAGKRFLELTEPETTHDDGEEDRSPRIEPERKRLYSSNAIYEICPCSEEEAMAALREQRERSIPF